VAVIREAGLFAVQSTLGGCVPLVETLIATRARKVVLAAAAAGAVFTLFTLVGVGAATRPLAGSFGTGESILEARYGSERVVASGAVRERGRRAERRAAAETIVGAANRQRSNGSRPTAKPTAPLPGAPGHPAAPRGDAGSQGGAAPSPGAPSAPTLETQAVTVPETPPPPVPTPTLPTLPAPPELPPLPALPPPLPAVPQAPVPAVPGVLP
jgi:hypothetical protein